MDIELTMAQALEIAVRAYSGSSDVLTTTRQRGEDVASRAWWLTDHGRRADRGWQSRRDGAALITYRALSHNAAQPLPPDEFPVEFRLADGTWCRPDKDIIKQGTRRGYLAPVMVGENLLRSRLTDNGLRLLELIFPNIAADGLAR